MKKAIIGCLAILLAMSLIMIAACDLTEIGTDPEGTNPYTFDANGEVVGVTATVNANGDFVIPAFKMPSRAVNKVVADRGIEIFEVVFLQGPTATKKVARAQWELGKAVSVKNVPRGTAGVDYIGVNPSPATALTAAQGAAVLFAGRKNGTLLAVGRISAIDGTAIGADAIIDAGTRSVTFSLAALVGNATEFVITHATADLANIPIQLGPTTITPASYNYKGWTLKPGVTDYAAIYTLDSSASTSFPFADMVPAIRLVGGGTASQITARVLGVSENYEIPRMLANITPSITTTLTANAAFPAAPIAFNINSGTDNGIVALYFKIPVYPVDSTISDDKIKPYDWFITNGYDYNYLDIGPNGTGGSIFIAIESTLSSILDFSDGLVVITGPIVND